MPELTYLMDCKREIWPGESKIMKSSHKALISMNISERFATSS